MVKYFKWFWNISWNVKACPELVSGFRMTQYYKAFTLVELILVITILAILWTIAFISLQGYSRDARDSKRISDIRQLLTKVSIEWVKWVNYSNLIKEEWKKENILIISWTTITWYQNMGWLNFETLHENAQQFSDPKTRQPYPFAYSNNWINSKVQFLYKQESESDKVKLVWDYYQILEIDSPSLFTNSWTTWDNVNEDYIIGDTVTPLSPSPQQNDEPNPDNCEAETIDWYDVLATNHWHTTPLLTKTWTLSWWWWNWYSNYEQTFTCDDWNFTWNWETENSPTCDINYTETWSIWSYSCVVSASTTLTGCPELYNEINWICYKANWEPLSNINGWVAWPIKVWGVWWVNLSASWEKYKWSLNDTLTAFPTWSSSSWESPSYWRDFDITNYPAFLACASVWTGWHLPIKEQIHDNFSYYSNYNAEIEEQLGLEYISETCNYWSSEWKTPTNPNSFLHYCVYLMNDMMNYNNVWIGSELNILCVHD
jgi:prepilin-type N-terminal cleavage/methylation domain-containing protein